MRKFKVFLSIFLSMVVAFSYMLSANQSVFAESEDTIDYSVALNAPNVYTYPENSEIIETARFTYDDSSEKTYGYVDGTRAWQGIPGIECIEYSKYENSGESSGNRLWAAWYSGGGGESQYNYIILTTSEDDGKSWSDARVIIDPDNVGMVRAFDPVLWVDPNGSMWIFWNQEYGKYTDDGKKGVWGMYTEDPYSKDPTWSEPIRLCNGIIMNKPAVIDDENGEKAWVLCSYLHVKNEQTNPNEYGPNIYKFIDYGEEWETYSNMLDTEGLFPINDFLEHMLVQNEDGSLRVIIRTAEGLRDVVSTDYGKTWTGGDLMTDATGNIMMRTASRAYIGRIMDEDGGVTGKTQLMIYHDNTTAARDNLTAAISEDGGKTWPYKLTIEDTNGCSYPDAVQASDGTIYITYDLSRYGLMEIFLAKITVADIKAGKIVTEDSELYIRINNNAQDNVKRGWYDLEGTEDVNVENMAKLQATDNISRTVDLDLNIKIFTDRDYTLYAMPKCFRGALLLRNSLDNGTKFKALSDGEVYAMTPMSGENNSQQNELSNKGFSVVADNIEGLFSNQEEKMVLMKKIVAKGDEITVGKWSIILSGQGPKWYDLEGTDNVSVDNMAYLQPTDNISVLERLNVGIKTFTDRDYTINNIPSCFYNALLLRNSLDNGTRFKALSFGEVYVMTPMSGENNSQQGELSDNGFSVVTNNIEGFFTNQKEKLVLMKKIVAQGDEITVGKWSIILSGPTPKWYSLEGTENISVDNMAYLQPTDNVSELEKLHVGVKAFTDRAYTINTIPSCFYNTLLLRNSLATGTKFKALSGGEVYVLTPIASNSQRDNLLANGFSVVETEEIEKFFNEIEDKLVLMKKTVTAGEEISIGKWSLVFSGQIKISGDFNGDKTVDSLDITLLRQMLLGKIDMLPDNDVNGDGGFDIRDLVRSKKLSAGLTI